MSKPIVSVVTPVYKTELSLLEKAYRSLKDQTLGFERLRWIVVVHNSGDAYAASVKEMFSGIDNILVETLENDGRGPSTPRNRGIELADTEYIAFLDSDDTFTDKCLESAIYHAEKTDSDITVFRRSYELETAGLNRVTEIVRWNQMRDEIVLTRDHWEEEKMFVGVWGMVTSRIYRRVFLYKNNIRFREEVPFGEDFMFNVEAYHHSDRICYLPQLIGYRYYINSTSLVQGSKKNADTLVAYAKGYRVLFETALKYGIYMNPTISRLCTVLSRFIIGCEDMTHEKRVEIRNLLGEYIEMTTLMEPDKIYPEAAVRECYELPRKVILDPAGGESMIDKDMLFVQDNYLRGVDIDRVLLRSILNDNENTDIGRFYRFSSIMTVSAFRERIPISVYEDYEPLISLQTEIGESGILTHEPITTYVVTAGTTGSPKRIPVIKQTLDQFTEDLLECIKGEDFFIIADLFASGRRFNDNTIEGSPFGIALIQALDINKNMRFASAADDQRMTGGDRTASLYAELLDALTYPDYTMIVGVDTRSIYDAFCLLESHYEIICDDIEHGTINALVKKNLSPGIDEYISKKSSPHPERASELRAIFREGFDDPIIKKIWPRLTVIATGNDVNNTIYTVNLKRYIGDIVCRDIGYNRPETYIGRSIGDGRYKLDISNTYFEFIPIMDGKEDDSTVSIHELKEGQTYLPVITSKSGFYRLRTEDMVKYHGEIDGAPVVSFEADISQSIYIEDIFITEKDICRSIIEMSEKTGIIVDDFVYRWDEEDKTIELFLEMHDDRSAGMADIDVMQTCCLESLNRIIDHGSVDGRVPDIRIYLTEPQTGKLYSDVQVYSERLTYHQIKPVRLLDTTEKNEFFRKHIIQLLT